LKSAMVIVVLMMMVMCRGRCGDVETEQRKNAYASAVTGGGCVWVRTLGKLRNYLQPGAIKAQLKPRCASASRLQCRQPSRPQPTSAVAWRLRSGCSCYNSCPLHTQPDRPSVVYFCPPGPQRFRNACAGPQPPQPSCSHRTSRQTAHVWRCKTACPGRPN
jgi:hypothetical protein